MKRIRILLFISSQQNNQNQPNRLLMNYQLSTLDYIVFLVYFVLILSYGYYIYKKRHTKEQDSKAFFLAEGSLTWWAIGASLIASNISA